MSGRYSQDVGEIKALLKALDERMDRVDKFLDGNGQPGARDRITKAEQTLANMLETLTAVAESQAATKDQLTTHLDARELHGVRAFLSLGGVIALVSTAVVAHLVVPPDFSLWDLLTKWAR